MSTTKVDSAKPNTDRENLRQRANAAKTRHGFSLSQLSARIGVSPSTISQWLSGQYGGDNEAMDKRFTAFLDGLDANLTVQGERAVDPGFQQTVTAERIWSMMTLAQRKPAMVVAGGAPGLGKTMTAKSYASTNNNVWHVTMDPTVSTPSQMLYEIAQVMGEKTGDPVTLRNRIGERMQGAEGLLILDESQHLNPKSLDMARSLYDRFGVGICFLGNYGLFTAVDKPSKEHGFAQFYSRIQKRAWFGGPAVKDIAVILDAWGITEHDQRKFLGQIARKSWGLRGVSNTIDEATALALGANEPLELKHLQAAWRSNLFEDPT